MVPFLVTFVYFPVLIKHEQTSGGMTGCQGLLRPASDFSPLRSSLRGSTVGPFAACRRGVWGGDLLLLNQDAWIFYDDPEDLRT